MDSYNYVGDKFYIGDIPLNENDKIYFFYEENGNIRITENPYNKEDTDGINTYRIYRNLQGNKLLYESIGSEVALVKSETLYPLKVSHKWYDRPDCLNILIFSLVVIISTLWVTNIFTSIFKKGGILSGLF